MGSTNVRIGSTIFGPREYPKKKWKGNRFLSLSSIGDAPIFLLSMTSTVIVTVLKAGNVSS